MINRQRLTLTPPLALWYTDLILRKGARNMRWTQNGLVLHFLGCDMAIHGISAPFFR